MEEHPAAGNPPGGFGINRRMESEVTDLPLPDSPTIPTVSRSDRVKLTSSTARTKVPSVSECVLQVFNR